MYIIIICRVHNVVWHMQLGKVELGGFVTADCDKLNIIIAGQSD